MTTIFRYFSSAMHCRPVGDKGVIEVRGTGPLLEDAYYHFSPLVLDHIRHAPAAVLRFDTTLHMITEPPNPALRARHPSIPPQAFVVGEEHALLWLPYAENLWHEFGLVRTVWSSSRQVLAYHWADQIASRKKTQPERGEPTPSGPAPLS